MKKSVHIKISGKVQGVFFRQSTKEKADELGITGWVRNCGDGSVELEANGKESAMKKFIEWCHHGPERAVVSKVILEDCELGKHKQFLVLR